MSALIDIDAVNQPRHRATLRCLCRTSPHRLIDPYTHRPHVALRFSEPQGPDDRASEDLGQSRRSVALNAA